MMPARSDLLGLAAIAVYFVGEITLAVQFAPHCERHVRDWGDLKLRGPDACVDYRPRLAAPSPTEGTSR